MYSAAYARAYRLIAGLSVDQLAERSRVSRETIQRVEAGETTVRPATVRQLADALGVETWRLWVLPEAVRADLARDGTPADTEREDD